MNKKKNNNNSHGKKKAQNKDKFSKNGNYLFNSRTRSPKRGQDITTTQSSPQK
jgi:hypothetical protein